MVKFSDMNEEQKNLYGLLDFLISASFFTEKPLSYFINGLYESNKYNDFFDLGWFKACGVRSFNLSFFLDNWSLDKFDTSLLKNNKAELKSNAKVADKMYLFLINRNIDNLKICLIKNVAELDEILMNSL